MDRTLSQTFRWIRLPLTLLVILIHSGAPEDVDHWAMEFYVILFKTTVAQTAVPVFFLMSGFLFFNRMQQWDISRFIDKLKRRIRTLLVPYLLWNLFPLTMGILGIAASGLLHRYNPLPAWHSLFENINWVDTLWGNGRWNGTLANYDCGYPADIPMWYVRDLMIMVLLSPLIHYLTKKFKGWFVGSFAFICVVFNVGELEFFIYYIIGAFFSITLTPPVTASKRIKYLVYAVAFVALAGCVTAHYCQPLSAYLRPLSVIFKIFSALAILYCAYDLEKCTEVRIPPLLYECSFFVFALHIFYMLAFARTLLGIVLPWHEYAAIRAIRYILKPVVTYLLCMLVFAALRKICPAVLKLYSGSRIVA